MAKEVAPQTQLYGKIIELVCSNGESFMQEHYTIAAFSSSSFIVRPKRSNTKLFGIIPTRCVDRIWMEEEDDTNGNIETDNQS